MHKVGLLASTIASTRRGSALSPFRLASVVLRGTTGLYEKQPIESQRQRRSLDCRFAAEMGCGAAPLPGPCHHRNRRRSGCP
jgi:hypothetical protein